MVVTESMVFRGSSGMRQLGLGGRNAKEDRQGKDVPERHGAVIHRVIKW